MEKSSTNGNVADMGDGADNAENIKSPEEQGERNLRIGKLVLGAISYHDSHKKVVDKSYERVKEGYKFERGQSPASRRVEAFLVDIERMPDDERAEYMNRSMEESIGGLTAGLSEVVQTPLKEQLKDWRDYLCGEDNEYPTWFKLWAWEGMTKLGKYDGNTKLYSKRSKNTIASFPPLDKGALAETYKTLESYHNGERGGDNDELDQKYIASANFNALYSHFVNKHIVPTPEYGEAIHGGWVEYRPGDEERVADAVNGTSWCIVAPSKAREYLGRNDSSFHLLHLQNPETGELDRHACASIRMEDGKVAEISGRKPGSGQMLEDSLVETVEAKVLTMPGGEAKRQAFLDRKELIRLSRKEDPLTKEELEFVYEVNRNIEKLELHAVLDDHVVALKAKYDIETAISLGVDKDKLVESILDGNNDRSINEENIIQNLDGLLKVGVPHSEVLSRLAPASVWNNIDRLDEGGVGIGTIAGYMGSKFIAVHVKDLVERGLDANQAMGMIMPGDLDAGVLLENGADAEMLLARLRPEKVLRNLEEFRQHGVEIDVETTLDKMSAISKLENYDTIKEVSPNYDIYGAVKELDEDEIWRNTYYLRGVGDFVGRPDIDPIRFTDAASEGIMEFAGRFVVAKMKDDLRAAKRMVRYTSGGMVDEEDMKACKARLAWAGDDYSGAVDKLEGKLRELGANSGY